MIGLPFLPPDRSAHGPEIDRLLLLVHLLMLALFIGWGAFFIYSLIRFRKRRNPRASYVGYGNKRFSFLHETGVALFEIVLLIGFAIPVWLKVRSRPPAEKDAVVVRVVAEQYAWNIHYSGPDGVFGRADITLVSGGNPIGLDRSDPAAKDDIVTINDLHLPVGKPALIKLSTKDVIHSFFLPEMRVKQDAIPGQSISVWFTPTVISKSEIACAQLCGLGHYRMRGSLTIESEADFQRWLGKKEGELQGR